MTLGKRIKKARLIAGLNQQALADAISQFGDGRTVSRTAVVQWESETTRGIEAANLLKAAKVLNVAPEWLQFGTGLMRPVPAHLDGLLPIICNRRSVPILDDAMIANDEKEAMELDNVRSYVGLDDALASIAGPYVFALEIKGDSMSPEFKPGDIVVIDPQVKPQPGEIIVAKLHEGTVTLRKYRPVDTGAETFELISLNVDWPKIVINSENPAQILGTLIEHRCRRRTIA
jgi:SOS-response transcriptional repressor LexA